jgi:hypothetical protein
MSAYMVGYDHIDALLSFASTPRHGSTSYYVPDEGQTYITTANATEIGRILLRENERSINARYPDQIDMVDEPAENYVFKSWPAPLSAVSILKACSCFDYQACETDDYDKSLAWTIINAIRARAISRLPGYEDAPGWEFRRPKTA